MSIPTPNSLVKYASAVLVSTSGKLANEKKQRKDTSSQSINAHTEDILNSILPPREFTMEKQQLWIQCVSASPATRGDVLLLQEQLDKKLQQRIAKQTGICPIREELYAQCFDELIRQITINCAERGLLLVKVRDELRLTIQTYQTLYESSTAYGMRKILHSERKKNEMQMKLKELEQQCSELIKAVELTENNMKNLLLNDEQQQQTNQLNHAKEVTELRKNNQQKKQELEELLRADKKQ